MHFTNNEIDYSDPAIRHLIVLYTRVSDRSQMDGASGLGSQETRGREYAHHLGLPVVRVFSDEAISGKLRDRPGMRSMLTFLKRAPADVRYVVVIDDISRLARDVRVFFELRDAIHITGALLESPTMKFKNSRDADGNFYEGIQALGAQHYREKVAETTKNRCWARMMNGYWVFHAPIGYKYVRSKTEGGLLVRDDPVASIIKEALEGYASGRFAIQAEVQRFLESQPGFTRRKPNGTIRAQVVSDLLDQPLYAGYLESKMWDVPFRKARHEPLISLETFEKIQARRKQTALAPARKDIHLDFPLRGAVHCACCGKPLRACWSKSSTGKRHPYYLCQTKGCEAYGKSIRRDKLEGDFVAMLRSMRPSASLTRLVTEMVKYAWEQRMEQVSALRTSLKRQTTSIEKQIDELMDKLVDASSELTAKAYERRIEKLEKERLLMEEKLENGLDPNTSQGQILELSLKFLSNPCKLWESGNLILQKLVLRLAFAEHLSYCKNEGYRTPKTNLPFKVLGGLQCQERQMVPRRGLEPPLPYRN